MAEPGTVTGVAVLIVTLIGGFWANLNGLKDLKGEVKDLRDDMRALRGEMHAGDTALRAEMHAGNTAIRSEMATGFISVKEEFTNVRVAQAILEYRMDHEKNNV